MNYQQAGRQWANSILDKADAAEADFEAKLMAETVLERGSRGILICEGDSWFDYRPLANKDILKWLDKKHGFDVREAGPHYGDTLREMVDDCGQFEVVRDCLERVRNEGAEPRAILLSGGGNDIATKEDLAGLLNHKLTGLPPLKEAEANHFIFVRLRNFLIQWISAVDTASERYFGKPIPVFVQGYCKPVPNGDAFGWDWIGAFPGPWLKPAFVRKGYWGTEEEPIPERQALEETTPVIGALIDKFNEMLLGMSEQVTHMHHLDVRAVLTNDLSKYERDWANELHPRKKGFKSIADEISRIIEDKLP